MDTDQRASPSPYAWRRPPERELTPAERLGREFVIGDLVAVELDDHRAHGGTYLRRRSVFDGERQRNVVVLGLLGTHREIELDVERIVNVSPVSDRDAERFAAAQRYRRILFVVEGRLATVQHVARRLGVTTTAVTARLRRNGNTIAAISKPRRELRKPRPRPELAGKSIAQVARESGVSYRRVHGRLERGLPIELVTSPLPRPGVQRYEFRGEQMTLSAIARAVGIPKATLTARVRAGLTLEQAVSLPRDRNNRWKNPA